jgi:hypothetical protein
VVAAGVLEALWHWSDHRFPPGTPAAPARPG